MASHLLQITDPLAKELFGGGVSVSNGARDPQANLKKSKPDDQDATQSDCRLLLPLHPVHLLSMTSPVQHVF